MSPLTLTISRWSLLPAFPPARPPQRFRSKLPWVHTQRQMPLTTADGLSCDDSLDSAEEEKRGQSADAAFGDASRRNSERNNTRGTKNGGDQA
jgi:hypothetical protein